MKYRTIVADPPWDYGADGKRWPTRSRTPGKWTGPVRRSPIPYPAMALDELCALPISDLADTDARLFLWATNRHLPVAFSVVEAWGFTYRQTLTWKKLDGLSGSVAPNSEFLLVAMRGSPGLIRRLPNAVIEHSQTKEHSRKPDVFLDIIESASPGPYLELFARRQRLGWDVLGNEVGEKLDIRESMSLLAAA